MCRFDLSRGMAGIRIGAPLRCLIFGSLLLAAAPAPATSCYTNYRGIVTTEPFIPGYGYAVGAGGECAFANTTSHTAYEYPAGSGTFVVPSNSVALSSTPGGLPQTPPRISISGDAVANPAFAGAFAAKSYQVFLSPLQEAAQYVGLPVSVLVTGSITATASAAGAPAGFDITNGGSAAAHAQLTVNTNDYGFLEKHNVDACAYVTTLVPSPGNTCAISSSQTNTAGVSMTVPLVHTNSVLVRMQVDGLANVNIPSVATRFSAVADPYMWIDPAQLIEVNGALIPANQLFTLVGDAEVNFLNVPDPAYVPLPSSLPLIASGFVWLAFRSRRRRTANPQSEHSLSPAGAGWSA